MNERLVFVDLAKRAAPAERLFVFLVACLSTKRETNAVRDVDSARMPKLNKPPQRLETNVL